MYLAVNKVLFCSFFYFYKLLSHKYSCFLLSKITPKSAFIVENITDPDGTPQNASGSSLFLS